MPVGFSCHIFDTDSQDLAEQVVMATAQAFKAIQESFSDSVSYISMASHESRDSGMSKGSSRLSYPAAAHGGSAGGKGKVRVGREQINA
jgi:hypothetical protein